MDKKVIISIVVVTLALMGGGIYFVTKPQPSQYQNIDEIAKCLTEKGFSMYGAYSCSHCQTQKKMFGDAFQYINYVECTVDTEKCLTENVQGYPTWKDTSGKVLVGVQSISELSQQSSCPLPE